MYKKSNKIYVEIIFIFLASKENETKEKPFSLGGPPKILGFYGTDAMGLNYFPRLQLILRHATPTNRKKINLNNRLEDNVNGDCNNGQNF